MSINFSLFDHNAASDVVIGGAGKDDLKGGDNHDILIGGTPSLRITLPALRALSAAWVSGKPIAPLASLTALGSVIDTEKDTLDGQSGSDWLISSSTDKINGKGKDDVLTKV